MLRRHGPGLRPRGQHLQVEELNPPGDNPRARKKSRGSPHNDAAPSAAAALLRGEGSKRATRPSLRNASVQRAMHQRTHPPGTKPRRGATPPQQGHHDPDAATLSAVAAT